MTTLIAVYNSEGCKGRCDAKCYNATDPDCDCVCGGANHGAGLAKAMENTRQMAEHMIEEYARSQGLDQYEAMVNLDLVAQVRMPGF